MKTDLLRMGEGYAMLAVIVDVELRDIPRHSDQAKEELRRYAKALGERYAATTGSPSEYAVGFHAKPAFHGEKTAIAKFLALIARAWEYGPDAPMEFAGFGYWVNENGFLEARKLPAESPT